MVIVKVYFNPRYTPEGGRTMSNSWTLEKPEQVFKRIREQKLPMEYAEVVKPASEDMLAAFHTQDYIDDMAVSFPDEYMAVTYRVEGQLEACEEAYRSKGCTFNLASGFHHAEPRYYLGFCMFNGLVVAHKGMQRRWPEMRTAVVDLDAHFGNGSNTCQIRDPSFANFGVPIMGREPDFDSYMRDVKHALELAAAFGPGVVEYNAGMDVLEGDDIGMGFLTLEQAKARDRTVLEFCKEYGLPVAVCLAGGYQPAAVEGHVNTYKEALRIFEDAKL